MELIQNTEVASRSLFSTERCPSRFMGGVKYVQIVESKKVERDADQVPLYSLLNLPGAALLAISTRARCRSLLPMSTRTRCRATHYEHAYQVPRYL